MSTSQATPSGSGTGSGTLTTPSTTLPSPDFASALYTFLDKLSPAMIGRLYEAPSSCLSIFRLLPPTAKHLLLNMLWYEQELTWEDAGLWVRERRGGPEKGERRHLESAASALMRLHIFSERKGAEDERILVFHERFRSNFKLALTGGGEHRSFGVPSSEEEQGVDVAFLDAHAETQWETILHYMVGSGIAGASKPSDKVLQLLCRSQLMVPTSTKNPSLKNLAITSKGFQFLLEDVNTQLWDFLLNYLEEAEDVVEVLSVLFMLGSLELGRPYSTELLSPSALSVLNDLRDYGLIYQPSVRIFLHPHSPIRLIPSPPQSPRTIYPTRLATTLTSSAAPLVSSSHASEENGFLIVETNYKVYAYTSNPLQIAVLNLFVSLKSRFPNFVTGVITRESIRKGLQRGIGANQIISYLTTRAHPQMRKQESILPSTVVDQIRLWEQEGQRVKHQEGYLYDDFSSQSDYQLVRNYAGELDVLLWETKEGRKLFVTPEGHALVREFIKRRMAAA